MESRSSWKASRMVPLSLSVAAAGRVAPAGSHPGVNGPGPPGEHSEPPCGRTAEAARESAAGMRTLSDRGCDSRGNARRRDRHADRRRRGRRRAPLRAVPAHHPRRRRSPALPPGVADVLAVLRSSGIVVDSADQVVKASPAAVVYGLVRDAELAHAELRHLARQVRRDGVIREAELDLARGPLGRGRITVARARRPARQRPRAAPGRGPHQGAPGRGGPPRLRRQRQPRAEDPGRGHRPAGRGGAGRQRRPRGGRAVRAADAGRERPADQAGAGDRRPVPAAGAPTPCTTRRWSTSAASPRTRWSSSRLIAEAREIELAVSLAGGARCWATPSCSPRPSATWSATPSPTPAAAHASRSASGASTTWSRSPSPTRAAASRTPSRPASSSGSTASTRRARGPPAAPASAWRSSSTSAPTTAATSPCGARGPRLDLHHAAARRAHQRTAGHDPGRRSRRAAPARRAPRPREVTR